jgi:DNA-binding transcriptional MerR regulator
MSIGDKMNYYFTGILIILLCLLAFCGGPKAWGDSTQSNTSGSNTSIEGGYESTTTTTYESGSESTSTTSNTTNSNIKSSPPSASAPSYNAMTQDVCAVGASAGIQTFGVGISGGKHFTDKNCERLKLARILNDFGMKVAAVAILCQDERVFESMIQAGTPCPIDGKIGKEAKALWSKYDHERPDYDIYVKRMKAREKKEKAMAKKAALEEKKRLKEEAKMTKELDKLDVEFDKQVEKKIEEKKKNPVNWESPK